mmetsp:Transcript_67171/g.188021  ORF Transcript_67171/g.188021 Transcript_67171/m.188021 type:complete len:358 (-) Transcript_67171:108-1181(-)
MGQGRAAGGERSRHGRLRGQRRDPLVRRQCRLGRYDLLPDPPRPLDLAGRIRAEQCASRRPRHFHRMVRVARPPLWHDAVHDRRQRCAVGLAGCHEHHAVCGSRRSHGVLASVRLQLGQDGRPPRHVQWRPGRPRVHLRRLQLRDPLGLAVHRRGRSYAVSVRLVCAEEVGLRRSQRCLCGARCPRVLGPRVGPALQLAHERGQVPPPDGLGLRPRRRRRLQDRRVGRGRLGELGRGGYHHRLLGRRGMPRLLPSPHLGKAAAGGGVRPGLCAAARHLGRLRAVDVRPEAYAVCHLSGLCTSNRLGMRWLSTMGGADSWRYVQGGTYSLSVLVILPLLTFYRPRLVHVVMSRLLRSC